MLFRSKLGNGLEASSQMGPLANARRIGAMENFVGDAKAKGAKIAAGGERHSNEGYFFRPTVLTDVPPDAKVLNDEPFGPVAPIMPFKTFDEVIERANALPFGLAAYAFTNSTKTATAVANEIESGMVGVNHLAISLPETPFGGIKDSGYGSEGGPEALDAYMNTRSVAILNA